MNLIILNRVINTEFHKIKTFYTIKFESEVLKAMFSVDPNLIALIDFKI